LSFDGIKTWLLKKHQAYSQLFLGSDNKRHGNAAVVWDDLRKYCGVDKEGLVVSPVTRMTDPLATAYRAGRRDVFLRIQKFTYFDFDEESTDGRSSTSSVSSDSTFGE
jgi:hypothetical protein